MRYNLYVRPSSTSLPHRLSSAQAMGALEEVFAATMRAEMGFDYLA